MSFELPKPNLLKNMNHEKELMRNYYASRLLTTLGNYNDVAVSPLERT